MAAELMEPRAGAGRRPLWAVPAGAPRRNDEPSLLVEPDRRQVLVEVVARRDLPALDVGAVRNDAVPPQRDEVVHLLVDHALLVGAHQPLLLGLVARLVHGVVELDELRILELAVLVAGV